MDFYRRKFKTKSNPNQDAVSVLNEKEYKCISLQAITSEVIKENNKKQIKNLIEETNGHLADLRVILEEETDAKIKERCQNLTKQFEESLLKLISSNESENTNTRESDSSNVFLPSQVKTGQSPALAENKQNKVILNEVEEKLKAMRQKRLNRLSTFVNEQTKLAEQRAEEGKTLEFETAIKSLQQKNDGGAPVPKKPPILQKVEETEKLADPNDEDKIVKISNNVQLASNKFLQNRNINKDLGNTHISNNAATCDSEVKSTSALNNLTSNTTVPKIARGAVPVKHIVKNSRPGFLKSVEEKPVRSTPNMENIKEEKSDIVQKVALNERETPALPMKLSTFGTKSQTDQPPVKTYLPTPILKHQETSKPLSPKPNMRKFLDKINACVIANDFEKSSEDIYKRLVEDNDTLTSSVVSRPKSVEATGKSIHQKSDIQRDAKSETENLKSSSESLQNKKELEYIEMKFETSRDYPLKINTVKQHQPLNVCEKSPATHKIKSADFKDESIANFGIDNPEYFVFDSKSQKILNKIDHIMQQKEGETTKTPQENVDNTKTGELLETSNPEYFAIELKHDSQRDSQIPDDENLKTQKFEKHEILPDQHKNNDIPVQRTKISNNARCTTRLNSTRSDKDYSFYQKRKAIKRLLNNWDNLSDILDKDSENENDDLEYMLENLDEVSDVVHQIQHCVKRRLEDNEKHAKNIKNFSKILHDVTEKLNDTEKEISQFRGLKRDAKYLQLSNQLSSYFLRINEISSSRNSNNVMKNEVLKKINSLVSELEEKVNRNEKILAKILKEQVELIGSKKLTAE